MPAAPSDVWVAPGVTAFIAPPGTPMSDSAAWKQIGGPPGASFVNGRIQYDAATRDWMAANWIFPQTWMTGVEQPKLSEANLKPFLDVISNFTTNERSKPMGLTTDNKYTDNDGDWISVEEVDDSNAPSDVLAFIETIDNGAYVTEKFSVPLALNVLGHDRPKPAEGSHVTVDGFFVPGIRIQGDAQRAELAAKAISYLKSVDIYDQQAAERKASEEAAAKREAEHKRRVAVKEDARVSLASAVRVAKDYGISPSRAEELIAAATDYRAAVAAVGAP